MWTGLKRKTLNELRSKTKSASIRHQYYSNISGDSCVVYTAFRSKAVIINLKAVTMTVENQARQTQGTYT
jgi:hypothetical protein